MSAKHQEENLSWWQRYKFYVFGIVGAILLIGSMSVQNVVVAYKTSDGTQYAAKLDYSAYGMCLRCNPTTKNAFDIVEKEIFFGVGKEKSVERAVKALEAVAGEEGGTYQIRVGGLLGIGQNDKNTDVMVEHLKGLGYDAVAIE